MRKRLLANLILLLSSLLIGFAFCEIAARLFTSTDVDGQVYLKQKPLLPYHFPVDMVQKKLDHYFENKDQAYVVDDDHLGWTIAPEHISDNRLYLSNSRGIRSAPYEYNAEPDPKVLRVALFGDSFTHGDELGFFRTWGYFLEKYLIEAGVSAEVINFGVGGYGIGQAYLRWNRLGKTFHPDIAVFGFQAENMQRTVNIIRSLYSRNTWLVFSKPRLILNPEGGLELINSPVIPPTEIPRFLHNFHDSSLARYEFWYNPANYYSPFWLKSRFFQILYNKFHKARPDYKTYEEMEKAGGVPESVSLAILRQFTREVEETGAIPIILHIPKKSHLKLIWKGETPAYYSLFSDLKKDGILVVDPAQKMKNEHHLYLRSHFTPKGGRILSRILADAILDILSEKNLLDAYNGTPPDYYSRRPEGKLLLEFDGEDKVLIDLGTLLDKDFIISGVHSREMHLNKTPVRWTTETAILHLPIFPKEGTTPILNIKIADTGPERESFDGAVTVDINGEEIGYARLDQGEKTYRIELSPKAIIEPTLITITITSPPWQPSRLLGSRDPRVLGVMLDRVKLEYE